ncbi:hypothetical protein TNCV_3384211 [Trichonephila clavipes]|uniref:Uncharacterized protein n=1 Tax=Trichonephila clavipes TaxID=2585209 RepID=A0A8X6T3P6_TRICX|nr:hypothetical protein TNCV_3384211 [Trichonephila clavipes]
MFPKFIAVIGLKYICHFGRSFEHQVGDSKFRFHSTPTLKEDTPWSGLETPTPFALSQTSREGLLSECSNAVQTLYIYKHPCLPQDSTWSVGNSQRH